MSSQIKNEYRELVNKYLSGSITSDEMEVLDRYYNLFRYEPDATPGMSDQEIEVLEDRLQKAIKKAIIKQDKFTIPLYKQTWFKIAAILLVFFSVTLILLKKYNTPQNIDTPALVFNSIVAKDNHFVILPDGSRIVLRAGSKLTIANNFKVGATRKVSLSGEAYFDIKHNNRRPFVIYTGNIKTTVLGTAFNIQAYSNLKTVIITVTRGRVKVERETNLIGILTPNKQLTASESNTQREITQKQVVSARAIDWVKTDMSFDAMPFSQLADHLDKRYGVHIIFKNPKLTHCPITGSFNGTESLTEVLDILSQTRGTNYAINGKQVIIDGKGCDE